MVEIAPDHRIKIVNVDTGKVVETLPTPDLPPTSQLREARRAPNGDLLVEVYRTRDNLFYWRDTNTGKNFPGYMARVSPDGSRIATVVVDSRTRRQSIRQYDFSTRAILTALVAVPAGDNYGYINGFDWTPDGESLVIAMAPTAANLGGLFVVGRDAHRLPRKPAVATLTGPKRFDLPISFDVPVFLANGHVVTFEYAFPIQHDGWAGAIVDVDLHTGVIRPIIGKLNGSSSPLCERLPSSTPSSSPKFRSCYLFLGGQSDARANSALMLDDDGNAWLSDGRTARIVARRTNANW